jgi:hypothetical protein
MNPCREARVPQEPEGLPRVDKSRMTVLPPKSIRESLIMHKRLLRRLPRRHAFGLSVAGGLVPGVHRQACVEATLTES